jgi:hypothetical protein
MSEDIPEITEHAHDRGPDGKPLPITKIVDVRGKGKMEVEVRPGTDGEREYWIRQFEDVGDPIPDDLKIELFEVFTPYEPADFNGADEWEDIRPSVTDALADAITAEIFDTGTNKFSEALDQRIGGLSEGNRNPGIQ